MAKTMASLQAFPSSLLPRAWSRTLIPSAPSLSNACHAGYLKNSPLNKEICICASFLDQQRNIEVKKVLFLWQPPGAHDGLLQPPKLLEMLCSTLYTLVMPAYQDK